MVVFLFCSNPDHFNTSSKFSGVDVNLARLLFHRVVQHDHPEITQLVSARIPEPLLSCTVGEINIVEFLSFLANNSTGGL